MSYSLLLLPDTEDVQALLSETKTLGWVHTDRGIEAWFLSDDDLSAFHALALEPARRVEEAAWDEKWKSAIAPVRVGAITVSPPWLAGAAGSRGIEIVIDPAMAFGTGHHATTRGCLAMVQRLVRPGTRVLDLGCGSGVLGITAAKLGAAGVDCVDTSEDAVRCARENAAANNAAVSISLGDAPPEHSRFDLIVANIQSSVVIPMREALLRALAPGGSLVLSGLLDAEGLSFPDTAAIIREEGWITAEIRPAGS